MLVGTKLSREVLCFGEFEQGNEGVANSGNNEKKISKLLNTKDVSTSSSQL